MLAEAKLSLFGFGDLAALCGGRRARVQVGQDLPLLSLVEAIQLLRTRLPHAS